MNYLVNSKLFCLHYFLKLKPLTLKEICVVPFELKLCIKIEDRKPETVTCFSFSIEYISSRCGRGGGGVEKFVVKMTADGEI